MPSITVNDHDGQQLLSVNLSQNSGLRRYLRAALGLRSFVPSRRDLAGTLTDHADKGRDIDFAVERPLELDVVTLQLAAGARVGVSVHGPESALIPASDIRPAVLVPPGTAVMSCSLRAVISAAAATPGAARLGFSAGTGMTLAYHHPFDLSGAEPTAGDALKATLEAMVLPADVEDLSRLAVGAIASTSGEGHIEISGSATMSALANPLATPGLPLVGSLTVKASASVTVGASWRLSGLFERRVTRLSKSRVRLEYFRLHRQSLTISAQASAGISATLRDAELVSMLLRAISSDPEADLVALVDAGLTNAQIQAMQQALALSINRSLTLSAEARLSASRQRGALFSYDIDLAELTAEGRTAVDAALGGSLSAIEQGGPGITAGVSGTLDLRNRSAQWRLNLFGVLNAASISTFVRASTSLYDPATGGLQLADQIARSRISITTRPFEADTQKIRKVTFESLTVTAAYQASRLLPLDLALTAQHTYVEQRARTDRRDMADHLRAIVGLGLCSPAEAAADLGETADFGPSIFVIDCRFDRAACDALFLDIAGNAHPEEHFEQVGRDAMLALVPPDDPERAHRRWPLERPAVWQAMKAAGSDLGSVLPSHIAGNPVRLGTVRDDFLTIVFWATAMRRAALALAEMRTLLHGRSAETLREDAEFVKARRRLEATLAAVVANTQSQFGDPWDALVLEAASGSTARVQAVIVAPALSKSFEAVEPAPERIDRRIVAEARAARTIEWTEAQRQVFERHVVNLRQGELSGDGSFQSSKAQVERIFTEHLPAALATARARGERLRIVFYAHGGLTDEAGGLRMPLARRAFWLGNGVYPIYFAWETGFREALADLIGGVIGRRPGLEGVSDIADAAIERGARLGGRPVWSSMQNSAVKASRSSGGAALVARLTADLWRDASGQIELHAVGHSAGSIFHAYFLPLLTSQKMPAGTPAISVQSLHFLAPAATNALFKKQLMPIIGRNKPINALTMYTMRDEVERKDPSVPAYSKSLLYLVRAAFEEKTNTELVGLEISLKRDLDLIRFFGLGGRNAVAEIVFSTTAPDAPLTRRSSSVEHGDFDNDVDTMNSMMRRMLGVSDAEKIVDYHEEPVEMPVSEPVIEAMPAPVRGLAGTATRTRGRRMPRSAPAAKAWTLLVWMAGDNNLESFGTKDLTEMKRVGSTDDVDVVVQFDRQTDDRTRRYHVKAGGAIDDDVVEELGETNTGDPAIAADFFRWGMQRFPSKRVLTVLWNHGSGVDDTDIYARAVRREGGGRGTAPVTRSAVRTVAASRHRRALFSTTVDAALNDRAIAFDDTSRDFLDTLELQRVLAESSKAAGRAIDLVGFDACLMNMVEIAHQLRGTTGFIVGSEDIEPGDGWPYDRVLEALNANPSMDAGGLGKTIVDCYVASYSTGRITQSLVSVERIGALSTAIDKLAKALLAAIKTPAEYVALSRAVNGVQRFRTVDFADLSDFCDQLRERSGVAAVKNAAKAVQQALAAPDGAVLHERHKGPDVARAGGAAIYLPAGGVAPPYTKLDFAKQTAWRKLLDGLRAS